jgi:hypothetical protein
MYSLGKKKQKSLTIQQGQALLKRKKLALRVGCPLTYMQKKSLPYNLSKILDKLTASPI